MNTLPIIKGPAINVPKQPIKIAVAVDAAKQHQKEKDDLLSKIAELQKQTEELEVCLIFCLMIDENTSTTNEIAKCFCR